MKRFLKIFLFSLSSLFALLLITIAFILFIVFTPSRFTPVVRSQADKLIKCRSEIGEVELTFFSTFPEFGVKIKQFLLINPATDSQFDTLLKVDELIGTIDAAAWWKRNELILTGLELKGGSVNVFSDSLGVTNYDIFESDTASDPGSGDGTALPVVEIRNLVLDDVNMHYYDISLKLNAVIRNLSARISGTAGEDNISGHIRVKRSVVSFEYDNEKYLQNVPVNFDIPVGIVPSRQVISLNEAKASINDLEFLINGSIENDTANHKIITDINYQFSSWPVERMIAMIPPSFNSYIKGIRAEGVLTSEGRIKGIMTDSVMPLFDIHMLLEKGAVVYSGFALPLHGIEGDITLSTDLKSDASSFLKINRFKAKTPSSSFSIEGLVNHLFTDIYCDLTTNSELTLDEFSPLVPDSMKVKLTGKVTGRIRSSFTMKQIERMQLERIKIAGSLKLKNFDVSYDSITLRADQSDFDFSMPNYRSSGESTKFASAAIRGGNIYVGKLDSYEAYFQNASLKVETSDARDTARIPEVICMFNMDSLSARMDTMSIAITKPHGRFALSPQVERGDQPRIILSYGSEELHSTLGHSTLTANTINFDTDIMNDSNQKEIYRQWLVKGSVDINQGIINVAGLTYPVEIPSLKMSFNPEEFNIKESIIKIDKSDFKLTGVLNNISSYFKGDSLLKANFNFVSNTTDISQLMALTNGIGNKDSTETQKSEIQSTDSTYTGPYMVPKGMDLLLNTKINTATMGVDTAANISGSVRVHDGVLVLDGLTFDTPAARMQLTAIYRTPRKNHIFIGIDYHMLDIEISELLTMIPDIDSLMPMLRSFSGKGEFHIAVETYTDSLYNIKKSTLRGASSIKGNDLVLMDGETFSEIAKTLRFNKKTQNRVDSLSAEFTIFRNEIDVYPFLIVLDKYKAVIAGRHNFDLTYDYHISVVDCPLPIKLGIDVKGDADNMSYKPARCRYAAYYRPSSRHAVENKQLELRKLIRETLTQKVKD